MTLNAGCPRCPAPVSAVDTRWVCAEHGEIVPLWRPDTPSYESFAEHLQAGSEFPTYLPWPLGGGWSVSDFALVANGGDVRASMTCLSGASVLDGPVDVLVISEEPGTGLGARIARTPRDDPGDEIRNGQPAVKVRVGSQDVPLWSVSISAEPGEWDRSVVAGEADGRWLWMVLRPASAVLLLRDDWILRDVSTAGPHLLALPFDGTAPPW